MRLEAISVSGSMGVGAGRKNSYPPTQANVESWATVTKLERMRLTQDGDSVVIWRSDL